MIVTYKDAEAIAMYLRKDKDMIIQQNEILEKIPLLDEQGRILHPGFSRKMNYIYNRDQVRAHPFALKEWDFYQISCGEGWILQMTIGHVSYAGNFSAALFNIYTGVKKGFSRMSPFPLKKIPMTRNPELPSAIGVQDRDYRILFQTGEHSRLLTLRAEDSELGLIDIRVHLENDPDNEKMVIATPFDKPNQFYLNYKENYYRASGRIIFDDLSVTLKHDANALLDWGRGVWPFHQEWYWGNGACLVDGVPFGFNIGWGFGDLSCATENIFFYNRIGIKLDTVTLTKDEKDWRKPWHFKSSDGAFDFHMKPVFDNDTRTELAFVKNRCHQVFGILNGTATLPDGRVIHVKDMTAFCEHAVNRW